MRVSELWRYPVKSARGERLRTSLVEPWGLAGDRRWMIVDADWRAITARERPQLILTVPTVSADQLALSHPSAGSISIDYGAGERVEVDVWGNLVGARHLRRADDFVSAITGRRSRLVYLDDPTRRRPNPAFSHDGDRVSLADSYPVLLASESSLDAVNAWIAEGPRRDEGPIPMRRFRPNIVVADSLAWDEDRWRRVRIGTATFRVVKASDRCVLTTIDPDTARGGKEPIASLARHRRWDGKTWFAVNLIPDAAATLHEGDDVEILDSVESFEPQR